MFRGNDVKKLFLLPLLLLAGTRLSQAQNAPPEQYNRPAFTTYLDFGLGTTGADIGISARTRNHLTTSIFLKALYHAPDTFNNFNSGVPIVAIKAKLYKNEFSNGLFAGPMAGAHDFSSGIKPLFGIAAGYDRYTSLFYSLGSYRTRIGVELQGGLDTVGNKYIGVNINIGVGFLNTGETEHH